MGSEWASLPFDQAVLVNPSIRLEKGQEYAFVDMAAVDPNRRGVCESERRMSGSGGARFKAFDTLLARITPCLENGKIARFEPSSGNPKELAFGSTEFIVIRGREGFTDNDYAYYLTKWEDFRQFAIGQMTGSSGRQRVPADSLSGFQAPVPPLPEQKAIAQVLGSLDDKIELNRQMNSTLEAMAQALFKSWFVDFDPVIDNALAAGNPIPDELQARAAARESLGDARKPLPEPLQNLFPASFTNTEELGWIPEGWEVGNLGTIAKQKRKGAKPEDIPAGTPYIGLQDMPQRSISLNSWGYGEEVTSGKSWFTKGDILFGKLRPYFHKVGIAPVDGVCSTDIVVVEPKAKEWFGYSLCVCSSKSFVDYTSAGSTGTKMPRTSWQDMAAYPLPIPTKNLAKVFNDLVNPSAKKIVFNILANRDLAKTRDTLLPKLLSGELRLPIEELEVAV